jgi:hypothetical protein
MKRQKRQLLPLALVGALVLPAAARAQPAAGARGQAAAPPPSAAAQANLEVDPIRCWWRTSEGAVRVGETFSVVLTCAALQTDAVQVVPDESRLDPTVAQMAPFEVTGGAHPTDLYSGDRRFFQYEYYLRVINPDVIGKDIKIPDPLIHYRINSTVAANAALQGREHNYLMPPLAVRVLSLVPADAPDIRDSSKDTFSSAEQLSFRASVVQIVAITTMAVGVLILVVGLVRLLMRTRKQAIVGVRGLSEGAILRAASRELASVQRDAEGGWNHDLAARALAATRIPAATALGRPVNQYEAHSVQAGDGRLITGRGLRRTPTIISGAGTSGDMARALDRLPQDASERQVFEDLQAALAAFTAVTYAREAPLDRSALDQALERAVSGARKLRSLRAWPRSLFQRRGLPRSEAPQHA